MNVFNGFVIIKVLFWDTQLLNDERGRQAGNCFSGSCPPEVSRPTRLWGTWRVNQHLVGRLWWKVHADVPAILDEYFRSIYPTTEMPMPTVYKAFETNLAQPRRVIQMINLNLNLFLLP